MYSHFVEQRSLRFKCIENLENPLKRVAHTNQFSIFPSSFLFLSLSRSLSRFWLNETNYGRTRKQKFHQLGAHMPVYGLLPFNFFLFIAIFNRIAFATDHSAANRNKFTICSADRRSALKWIFLNYTHIIITIAIIRIRHLVRRPGDIFVAHSDGSEKEEVGYHRNSIYSRHK